MTTNPHCIPTALGRHCPTCNPAPDAPLGEVIHSVMYRDYKISTLCNSGAWGAPMLFTMVIDKVTCPGCQIKLDGVPRRVADPSSSDIADLSIARQHTAATGSAPDTTEGERTAKDVLAEVAEFLECLGCGQKNPTGLHIRSCPDAQRKVGEPPNFAPLPESAGDVEGRRTYEGTVLQHVLENIVVRDDLTSSDVIPDWIGVITGALIAARPALAQFAKREREAVWWEGHAAGIDHAHGLSSVDNPYAAERTESGGQ